MWLTTRPGRFTPVRETLYPFYGRLGGLKGRSGRVREISPPLGFDSRTVQPLSEPLYRMRRSNIKYTVSLPLVNWSSRTNEFEIVAFFAVMWLVHWSLHIPRKANPDIREHSVSINRLVKRVVMSVIMISVTDTTQSDSCLVFHSSVMALPPACLPLLFQTWCFTDRRVV